MLLSLPKTSTNEPFSFCSHLKWQKAWGSNLSCGSLCCKKTQIRSSGDKMAGTSFNFEAKYIWTWIWNAENEAALLPALVWIVCYGSLCFAFLFIGQEQKASPLPPKWDVYLYLAHFPCKELNIFHKGRLYQFLKRNMLVYSFQSCVIFGNDYSLTD